MSLLPFDPSYRIILTIAIIISIPCVGKLISAKQKRCSLRKEKEGKGIFDLFQAKLQNCIFSGFTFYAAIPCVIIICSVLIFLTICLIMFSLIRDTVIQGKTVIICKIIDHAMVSRIPSLIGQHIVDESLIPFQEATDVIFVGIPISPPRDSGFPSRTIRVYPPPPGRKHTSAVISTISLPTPLSF